MSSRCFYILHSFIVLMLAISMSACGGGAQEAVADLAEETGKANDYIQAIVSKNDEVLIRTNDKGDHIIILTADAQKELGSIVIKSGKVIIPGGMKLTSNSEYKVIGNIMISGGGASTLYYRASR